MEDLQFRFQDFVKQVVSAVGLGDLHLYMFAMVPRIDATHFWASKHPEGHPEEVLMNQAEVGFLVVGKNRKTFFLCFCRVTLET